MTNEGWSKEAICGLLGNIEQESHLNPGAWQVGASNPGYGLIQSTPYKGYRKFLDWADLENSDADKMAQDDPKNLMDLQLEYLIYSSQTSTPAEVRQWFPTTNYASPYKMSYNEYIVSTNDVGELALVFHGSYERSGDTVQVRENRVGYAEAWYKYFSK